MLKKDNQPFGLLLGFIGPLLGIVIYYFFTFYGKVDFIDFLGYLKQYKKLLTGVSSLALVANAVIFTFYINSRRDRTAKGIFIATLIYAIGVLLIKLLG